MRQRPDTTRRGPPGAIARALLLSLWLLLPLPPPGAFAQAGFDREVIYTRAAGAETLRSVRVRYALDPAPSLTLGAPASIASPAGADGLCIAPDGDVLVAGGAIAPNAVHKVLRASGAVSTFSPGAGSPVALQLALDPAGDKVWAVCTASGAGRIARLPLTPFAQGVSNAITGADTALAHLCFAHDRTYYIAAGAAPGTGALGIIDLNTFATTRLLNGLDRPRGIAFDPFTGHLIIFGATGITQIDARPGMSPVIISAVSLAGLVPSIDLRSGTIDGQGRALALSATGHLALVDYSTTRQIGHSANPALAASLDAPGVLGSIVPLAGLGALRDGVCLWDNGDFDRRDGLPSHNSWSMGDTRTADDFYLCPGIHRIDSVGATMFSDSLFLTALIELYDDCNGMPGALLGSFPASVSDTGTTFQNLRVLNVHAPTPGLWLDGGKTYWVSAVGIGSLDGSDNWYWGTSGAPEAGDPPGTPNSIRGRPAYFRAPAQGVPEWTPSDQAGCGCTDFAFTIRGESCKILHDNGPPQPAAAVDLAGAPSIISTTNSDSRAADNFRVPPCADLGGERVCFIEATVYTNCSPVRGLVQIHDNDCALPTAAAVFSGPFSMVIDLGYDVSISGASLRAYRIQVHDPGWFLPAGRNYWLSVAVQGSGGFNQRAYFAANAAACDEPADCSIRISQSAVRGNGVGSPTWTLIENALQTPRDLSFRIAVAQPQIPAAAEISEPACPADADENGAVEVTDIFFFLSRWFQGCP